MRTIPTKPGAFGPGLCFLRNPVACENFRPNRDWLLVPGGAARADAGYASLPAGNPPSVYPEPQASGGFPRSGYEKAALVLVVRSTRRVLGLREPRIPYHRCLHTRTPQPGGRYGDRVNGTDVRSCPPVRVIGLHPLCRGLRCAPQQNVLFPAPRKNCLSG